jgi:hypothetical protein
VSAKLGSFLSCDDILFVFFRTRAKHSDKIVSEFGIASSDKGISDILYRKSKAFMKQDPFLLISTRTTVTTRIEEDNRTLEDLPMSKEN